MPAITLHRLWCHSLETHTYPTKMACVQGAWDKSSSWPVSESPKVNTPEDSEGPGSSPLGCYPSAHPTWSRDSNSEPEPELWVTFAGFLGLVSGTEGL